MAAEWKKTRKKNNRRKWDPLNKNNWRPRKWSLCCGSPLICFVLKNGSAHLSWQIKGMIPIKSCGYRRLRHKHRVKKNSSQCCCKMTNSNSMDQHTFDSNHIAFLICSHTSGGGGGGDRFIQQILCFFSATSSSSFVQLKCKSKRTGMTDGEIHDRCYPIGVYLMEERNVFAFLWIVKFSHTSYAFLLLLLLLLLLWHISNINTLCFFFDGYTPFAEKFIHKAFVRCVCVCVAFSSDWLHFVSLLRC